MGKPYHKITLPQIPQSEPATYCFKQSRDKTTNCAPKYQTPTYYFLSVWLWIAGAKGMQLKTAAHRPRARDRFCSKTKGQHRPLYSYGKAA